MGPGSIARSREWRHTNGSSHLGFACSLLPLPAISAWYGSVSTRGRLVLTFNRFLLPSLLLTLLVKWLWPSLIPFGLFEFWFLRGTPAQIFGTAWPIFAWSAIYTVLASLMFLFLHSWFIDIGGFIDAMGREESIPPVGELFRESVPTFLARSWQLPLRLLQAVWDSCIEELALRWCVFYALIVLLIVLDFLLLGFANVHILQSLYLHILGPVVDFFTFGSLHALLFNNQWGWTVGAAIVLIPSRKPHYELTFSGVLGFLKVLLVVITRLVNLLFFAVMFQYGLCAAILVSFAEKAFSAILFALLNAILNRSNLAETRVAPWLGERFEDW